MSVDTGLREALTELKQDWPPIPKDSKSYEVWMLYVFKIDQITRATIAKFEAALAAAPPAAVTDVVEPSDVGSDMAIASDGPTADYFAMHNQNIRNAQQFHEDVEFIHAAHIEGGIDVACREVFTRRERTAFEAGFHAQTKRGGSHNSVGSQTGLQAASGAPSEAEARRAGMTPGTYRMWRDAGGPAPHEANPVMEAKQKWAKIKADGPSNIAALEGIDLLFSLLEG
jgi:hypothetical protein